MVTRVLELGCAGEAGQRGEYRLGTTITAQGCRLAGLSVIASVLKIALLESLVHSVGEEQTKAC